MTTFDTSDTNTIIKNLTLDNTADLKVLAQYALEYSLFEETIELVIHIQEKIELRKEFDNIKAKVLKAIGKPVKKPVAQKLSTPETSKKRMGRPPLSTQREAGEKFTKSLRDLVEKVKEVKSASKKVKEEVKVESKVDVPAEVKTEVQIEAKPVEKKVMSAKQLSDRKRHLKKRLAKVAGTPKELEVLKALAELS